MTLFMDLGWSALGGAGVLTIALGYGAVGLLLARWLEAQGSGVAAGVCGAFVVALTPMAVYGFQQLMGWWPGPDNFLRHADGRRLYMGLDRKSTRLNSSHVANSYAGFCLKKKKVHGSVS